jgi:transcriptional regulator with XRE-family HTH domain
MDLTPKHIRAARALLAWSQQDLAKAASVATSTVADFERGRRTPVANNAQAIREALEGAGINFLPAGAVIGPTVPGIIPFPQPGMPIRWVTAEDLSDWANRMDGVASLPTLLAHLIYATHGPAARLRFPADEGVRYPGWDGCTSVEIESIYVPQGEARWEIGNQRTQIAQKATDDFRKRTSQASPDDSITTTFVFVTPRHWPKKDEWAKARQSEGHWREVRAYDADDLVHWIEQTPAVGLWLAGRLGKRPVGVRELEHVWEEWAHATQWPLTEDLVIADRDQDAAEVLRWLRAGPSLLALQATTTDEVAAFFHATLSMLPDDVESAYRARCLVVTTHAGSEALVNAPAPLILLLTEPAPGIAMNLVSRGHYVLLAYDERQVARGNVRTLARPSREGIANALINAGITEPRAEALARDSARNLSVLRRLIPSAPGRLPSWAQQAPPRALLAALLIGGWDESTEADRARVAEISDQSYEAVVTELAALVGDFDKPLQKVGTVWRVASPLDAWFLLAQYLTSIDIARFEAAAYAVLGSADPRFEMDSSERWMAAVKGVHPDYSGMLRQGVGQMLILLALWGDAARTVPYANRRADAIVERLLDNADQQRWWSLSRDFRLLAEASPKSFLSAIEDSLDQKDTSIRTLFNSDSGGVNGTEYLSDLLWALESLAWSPDLLPRVTLLLARLDAIDQIPARYSNRPKNSLRSIHLLLGPQTYATLDQRLRAIDLIRKLENETAWNLMLGILPSGHDSWTPSPRPRWRDYSVDKVEVITWGLIGRGAAAITDRLLEDVGVSSERWSSLLNRFPDLAPSLEAGFTALQTAEHSITNKADRMVLWTSLRRMLHRHRQFPDAEWSLPVDLLDRLQEIYERFAPTDSLQRTAWLFEHSVALPNPSSGWESEERDLSDARQRAAQLLFSEKGVEGVLALARLASASGYIGKSLYDSGLSEFDLDTLIKTAILSDSNNVRDLAHGLIVSAYHDRKEPWALALIAKAKADNWGATAILTILRALPGQRWTWNQIDQAGEEINAAYWSQTPAFWAGDEVEDAIFAIKKLISVGRARHALRIAARGNKFHLPSDLLVEVLESAANEPIMIDGDANETTMFQHFVAETLQILDDREDVKMERLAALEWSYLSILEYSRRPAKVLLRALSEQPSLFVEMLKRVFRPSEESGFKDEATEYPEQAKTITTQAYRLLELWDRLPGMQEDGVLNGEMLEAWIKEARALAKKVGREDIADSRIGNMLSASPVGIDGNWPAEAVRDVIDLFRSRSMIDGFQIGRSNRRGVTVRMPGDGGTLERQEMEKYRNWALAIAYEHPHTAKALDALADRYEYEAQRQDEEAERLDWKH